MIFSKQLLNLIYVKEFVFNKKFIFRLLRNELLYRNSSSKLLKYLRGKNFIIKNVTDENVNVAYDMQL